MIIYYLIITVFYLILLFLVRNTYDYATRTNYTSNAPEYVYLKEDKLKFPIWIYILITLLIYIYIVGIIIIILSFTLLLINYRCKDLYFHNSWLEKQAWFKFLKKEI